MWYPGKNALIRSGWVALGISLTGLSAAGAQMPGVPGIPPVSGSTVQGETSSSQTGEKTEPSMATPSGLIVLENTVKDSTVREALEHLLPKYPGVRAAKVEVDRGVVALDGQVESEDVLEGVTQLTRRVEGVRLVLNRMKTDAQVLTAWRFGAQRLERTWQANSREYPVDHIRNTPETHVSEEGLNLIVQPSEPQANRAAN
jgi:osmotically-inducible protein OsmY